MTQPSEDSIPNELRSLFPKFTEAQLQETKQNLDNYLQLVVLMYERISNDPEAYARFRALIASPEYQELRNMRRQQNKEE